MGVHIENSTRPDIHNPNGYFEPVEMIGMNAWIVKELMGFTIPEPINWHTSKKVIRLNQQAFSLISRHEAFDNWAIKQPALCLTLPFWKKFLPKDCYYIICVRNPFAIAKSTFERDGISISKGSAIWFVYLSHALRSTLNEKRILVYYEDYFEDYVAQINRITNFLQLHPPSQNIVETSLNHNMTTLRELMKCDEITDKVKLLYLCLLRAKQDSGFLDHITETLASENIRMSSPLIKPFLYIARASGIHPSRLSPLASSQSKSNF